MNIKQLRISMRKKRQQLTASKQVLAAQDLSQQLLKLLPTSTRRVAIYLANDGEIDPHLFIEQLWHKGIEVYLPVLHPFCAGNLLFLRFERETTMITNKYGISEPALDVRLVCPVARLDIIYTPLVAFDQEGNRMGMGGGYYDRTLANHRKVTSIGLAHNCQQVEQLQTQPWDIGLTHIVTPTQCINAQ